MFIPKRHSRLKFDLLFPKVETAAIMETTPQTRVIKKALLPVRHNKNFLFRLETWIITISSLGFTIFFNNIRTHNCMN